MQNIVKKTIGGVLRQADGAAAAALKLETEIGLWQNKSNAISDDYNGLAQAADAFVTAKAELYRCRGAAREAVRNLRADLTLARDNLKPLLGSQYSQSWDIIGLTGSLMIPRSSAKLENVARMLATFLSGTPAQQVPTRNITAAHFRDLLAQEKAAQTAVDNQRSVVSQALAEREKKFRALRKRVRGLIDELKMLLDPMDSRWVAFGFNRPGAPKTPEVPANVTAAKVSAEGHEVKWDDAPRAEHYRVYVQVVGVDAEPVAVESRAVTDVMLPGLPQNAEVHVSVSAVNKGGESRRSEVIVIKT